MRQWCESAFHLLLAALLLREDVCSNAGRLMCAEDEYWRLEGLRLARGAAGRAQQPVKACAAILVSKAGQQRSQRSGTGW